MNTVQFMEHFIKQSIIKEFSAVMALKGKSLRYISGLSNPILTMCDKDDHKKFCLTNVGYWDQKELHGDVYAIIGYLYNNGAIIIDSYDVHK